MGKKVVLAYSGGLDTSVAIEWIKDKTGAEVVAVAADVGQGGEDMNVIKQRALDCGAVAAEVLDLREEFANEYCAPALKANALYMDRYPLVSSLSRPIISKYLVEAAKKHDAYMVGHGCTGKGNDQVRFEVSIAALDPDLKVFAPVRDSGMTRDKAIIYAGEKNLPNDVNKKNPYSIDQNVWGRAIETGFLEDIWNEPMLVDFLDPKKIVYLPNTAGCYTAEEALRTLRLARDAGGWNLVKLEVLGDKETLYPNMIETIEALKVLKKENFEVMVYTSDDPILCKQLEDMGAAAIMPLGSLIILNARAENGSSSDGALSISTEGSPCLKPLIAPTSNGLGRYLTTASNICSRCHTNSRCSRCNPCRSNGSRYWSSVSSCLCF